jgi:hypothetical protein
MLGLLAVLCETPCLSSGAAPEQGQGSQAYPQGSALAGKRLFVGATQFRNGGPPCAACHGIAGVAFPNGGSLGPDLTGSYAKLGPLGLDAALQTLYFPAMTPIFKARPLTPQEREDLTAFFAAAQSSTPPRDHTAMLAGIALAGCAALLGLTWATARHQPEPVRQSLVRRGAEISDSTHELD